MSACADARGTKCMSVHRAIENPVRSLSPTLKGKTSSVDIEGRAPCLVKNTLALILVFVTRCKAPDFLANNPWECEDMARIFIVDDEPLMCKSLRLLLENEGHEVSTVTLAREAMALFRQAEYDLVLLDINMPEMDGLQLMDEIRTSRPETFVIMITGRASVNSAVAALRKGAFDYLRKPFEHDELLNTVRNALRQLELQRKRRQAEQRLREAHEELERRVEERTADLATANQHLKQEIEVRKKTEEKLHKTNEEVKHFVHVVSHDLKNPIIAIQGFSSRLLKGYSDLLGEKGLRYVDLIMTNARRMELLVSDLLTLSLIGRMKLDFGDVCCTEILENLASSLQSRLKEKGVTLQVKHELPTVYSCKDRLYQVFENLMVNAVKFIGTPDAPCIEVGHRKDGDFHVFYVRDNGIGIDPKHHKQIFEMFSRLKRSEDEEGTGLGLPIVEKIVATLGGTVWVESEADMGATFYFTLPKTSHISIA